MPSQKLILLLFLLTCSSYLWLFRGVAFSSLLAGAASVFSAYLWVAAQGEEGGEADGKWKNATGLGCNNECPTGQSYPL